MKTIHRNLMLLIGILRGKPAVYKPLPKPRACTRAKARIQHNITVSVTLSRCLATMTLLSEPVFDGHASNLRESISGYHLIDTTEGDNRKDELLLTNGNLPGETTPINDSYLEHALSPEQVVQINSYNVQSCAESLSLFFE